MNLLSSLFGRGQGSEPQNNPASSYYPSDAFATAQNNDWQAQNNMLANNNLLPLLLSLMGGNNSQLSALGKILSGGDPSALESLMKNNKKTPQENTENSVPHDDIIL